MFSFRSEIQLRKLFFLKSIVFQLSHYQLHTQWDQTDQLDGSPAMHDVVKSDQYLVKHFEAIMTCEIIWKTGIILPNVGYNI